jgi:hypothetical protein
VIPIVSLQIVCDFFLMVPQTFAERFALFMQIDTIDFL